MTGLRKAALIVTILAVGGALVYVNLTFERATGPEVEVEALVALIDGCEVNGKIFCPRIIMEDGAHFNGTIQMK